MSNQERKIRNLLEKGVSGIIDKENLEKRLKNGEKLRIKFGIDPTGAQVHIGHGVPIMKLRAFQDMGHQIVLIIGDATGQIGDASDKDAERPMLKRQETLANAQNYIDQIGKILDVSKLEIHYNSEWMDKISFCDVGELAKNFSVAEMLDRDNFSKRYKGGIRISLQEFLYPLMQGYDSVAIKADVELGGNDQYFNLLAGRKLQEAFSQNKQDIMTFNLIEGTDGRKMSKSYKNFIGLAESANDMFVKLMEINDELIIKYFEHCTLLDLEDIEPYKDRMKSGENPRNIKLDLAFTITEFYHGKESAEKAKEYFLNSISAGSRPKDEDIETAILNESEYELFVLIKELKIFGTSGEIKDAIAGGGIKINEEVAKDPKQIIKLDKNTKTLVQAGRKKFKNVVCN
ncbi:MAG: tyrosine--tRNA ligase [Candidatus Gracilibacteria bacterium]|nr:tyrosine--tRNA ligase [Candidatus Gracilibacteria bacterium]